MKYPLPPFLKRPLQVILLLLLTLPCLAQQPAGTAWATENYSDLLSWDDAQETILPEGQRLPTPAEAAFLCDSCTWIWTTYDGATGYLINHPDGETATFLPATNDTDSASPTGLYHTSALSDFDEQYSIGIMFDSANHFLYGYQPRTILRALRPVSEKQEDSGINPVLLGTEGTITLSGGNVLLTYFPPHSTVQAFTSGGAAHATFTTDSRGCLTFSTDSWSAGIYLIHANRMTYKIVRKK